jgi:ubiquinone/menaquinone biosynthesis C-methylase UbiE
MWSFARLLKTTALIPALLLAACGTDRASAEEIDRLAEALAIEAGMKVADVGAGDGEWSIALAERVGDSGHVFATEVDQDEIRKIEDRVALSRLSNITVVLGDQRHTGLPDGCCDAILLRLVYHHFVDPPAVLTSIHEALQPGGLLAVIDITPQEHWRRLRGVPERGGHGIPPDDLIEEITRTGFELVARYDDWNHDAERFCVVFRSTSRSDP